MAAVGAEVTGSSFLSSGLLVSIILLFLFLFLMVLCSECRRRSFELQDPQVDRNPSALIRVVKLEEVKENPMIEEIQKDEKEFHPKEDSAVTFSSSQLRHKEPETVRDLTPEEETSATFTPWRSHLVTPQSKDVNDFFPSDSAHVYDIIERGRGNSSNPRPQPPNYPPAQWHGSGNEEQVAHPVGTTDNKDLVYTQVNKKLPLNNSPEEEEPQEESSSPLPCTATSQ